MPELTDEQWVDLVGYEGFYMVSDLGRVKSLDRVRTDKRSRKYNCKGKILSSKNTNGYREVGLSKNGKDTYVKVHRLVALAFIPNPDNKPCVNHKDGDKSNNHKDNLEWNTYGENIRHAVRTGLYTNMGENSHYSKLTNSKVLAICESLDTGSSVNELARMYSVDPETIYNIKSGRTWNHLTGRKK